MWTDICTGSEWLEDFLVDGWDGERICFSMQLRIQE